MDELERLSARLEELVIALKHVCEIVPEDTPIHKKCKEMKEYIDPCLQLVDREIDKLNDAGAL